jgi:hemoglobin
MNPLLRARLALAAACLLGLAAAAPAADDKPTDSKALDLYLYNSLRFVINYGVDLYNAGQVRECYDHFRQSLQELEPVLAGHSDLQKLINDGLDRVEKDPDWRVKMAAKATMPNPQLAPVDRQKAFALRAVFNEVRNGLNPNPAGPKPEPKVTGLWNRLGGEKGVAKVVDDFTALAATDPKVDFTRGGKYKLDDLAVAEFKKKMVQFISANTGGPLKYSGKSMKEVHKGMGITNAQFDAAAGDLAKALAKNGVKAADASALLGIVETTRKDIVEGDKAAPPAGEGGTVKGRVTVGGKLLAKGTITLTGTDGKAISDAIEADGSFTLERVPPGAYKVSFTDGKNVPAAYGDPKTSGITTNVTKGANQLDLDLPGGQKPGEKPEGRRPRKVPDNIAAPAKAPERAGDTVAVSYKATYVFYVPDQKSEEDGAGTVSGKVTYKGKPLPAGTVAFHSKDGKAISTKLSEDGTYAAEKVPAGEYNLAVETDSAKGSPKYVAIPAKYADPKTSGLTYTVKKGKQQFDIALE